MKGKLRDKDNGRGYISVSDYNQLCDEWEKSVNAFNDAHDTDFSATFDNILLCADLRVSEK